MKINKNLRKEWRFHLQKMKEKLGKVKNEPVCHFSIKWANAMEKKMKIGLKLTDIAEETCKEVDFGITAFHYTHSINFLKAFWIHGEELRVWHNTQCGRPHERGIVTTHQLGLTI